MPGSPVKKPSVSNKPFLDPTSGLAIGSEMFPAVSKDQKPEKTQHKKEKMTKRTRGSKIKAIPDSSQLSKLKQHNKHDSLVKDTSLFEQLTRSSHFNLTHIIPMMLPGQFLLPVSINKSPVHTSSQGCSAVFDDEPLLLLILT